VVGGPQVVGDFAKGVSTATGAVVVEPGPTGCTRRGVVVVLEGENGTEVVVEEVVVVEDVVGGAVVVVEAVVTVVVVVGTLVVVVVGGEVSAKGALARSTLGLSQGVPPPLALHTHTVYEPAATNGTVKDPVRPPPGSTVQPPTWLAESVGIEPVLKCRSQYRPGVYPVPETDMKLPPSALSGARVRSAATTGTAIKTMKVRVTAKAAPRRILNPPTPGRRLLAPPGVTKAS